MRFKVLGALAVALLADVVPASAQMITQSQIDKKRVKDRTRMLKLTAEHFAKSATLKDDDLETIATIDTERGFRTPAGLFDIAGSDIFLRAHITKATGAVTYQAYEASWYTATQFRDYHSANFEAVEGVGTATLTKISARLGECGPHSEAIGCVRIEHSAFTVSETLLRQIAMRPADLKLFGQKLVIPPREFSDAIVSNCESGGRCHSKNLTQMIGMVRMPSR